MGMPGGGLDKEDFAAPMAEINTTPLVDVMLVLLVVFLVTAPMLTQAVKLQLPKETASKIADENPLTLSVDGEGAYYADKEALTEEEILALITAEAAANPERPVHIRADAGAAYGKVSKLLAALQREGLRNVGFVTEPEKR